MSPVNSGYRKRYRAKSDRAEEEAGLQLQPPQSFITLDSVALLPCPQ